MWWFRFFELYFDIFFLYFKYMYLILFGDVLIVSCEFLLIFRFLCFWVVWSIKLSLRLYSKVFKWYFGEFVFSIFFCYMIIFWFIEMMLVCCFLSFIFWLDRFFILVFKIFCIVLNLGLFRKFINFLLFLNNVVGK